MELGFFGWTTDGNSGGTIGGGGTLNYVAMFTPNGTSIGNAPIKIGDTVNRAAPINTGTNSVAMGYDITMSGLDSTLIGYDMADNGGQEIYGFGSRLYITGVVGNAYGITSIGFFNTINATGLSQTTGIYLMGDSNVFNDYNTYSTIIGEDNTLERIDHCTTLGLFNSITDSDNIYNLGNANSFNLSTSISNLGGANTIAGCSNVVNVGTSNAVSSISSAVVIGIGNINALSNEILIAQNDLGIRIDALGDVGIGVPSTETIQAKNHVKGVYDPTVANQRLEPINGVYEDTTGSTVSTTDATVTSLEIIAIPIDTIILIESYITCRKTAGVGIGTVGAGNGYVRTVKAQNIGGVVTIGTVQSSYTSESIVGFSVSVIVSGTNVVIRATGAINDNVNWNSITKKFNVS